MRKKYKNIKSYWPIFSSLILFTFFGFSFYKLFQQSRSIVDNVIAQDIKKLSRIFSDIEFNCNILSFKHEKNYIDFLNVTKFVGSEIGAMNLAKAQNWKGPYLKDNLSVQGYVYQIIKTKKGYYIVPGDGVKLSNKKIIGKDIILDQNSNIDELIANNILKIKDHVLAARVDMKPEIPLAMQEEVLDEPSKYI